MEEKDYPEERAEMKKACKHAGIDLTVVSDELSPGLWTQCPAWNEFQGG